MRASTCLPLVTLALIAFALPAAAKPGDCVRWDKKCKRWEKECERYDDSGLCQEWKQKCAESQQLCVEREEAELARRSFTVKGVRFEMVQVPATPAGGFKMGSPKGETGRDDDETQHTVHLTRPFWMATTEVTQALWTAVMGRNPSNFQSCGGTCPVEQVSWNDVSAFLKTLNQLPDAQGGGFRLPTEAEWEWAARARQGYLYAGSNKLDEVGWYDGNSGSSTHPVGMKKANAWGLFDMSGNVWEWVQDGYGAYPSGPVTNPAGDASASDRVRRGGSGSYVSARARVANRYGNGPGIAGFNQGLRLSRSE